MKSGHLDRLPLRTDKATANKGRTMKEYLTLKEAIELLALGYLTNGNDKPKDYRQRMELSESYLKDCLQSALKVKSGFTAYGKLRTLRKNFLSYETARLPVCLRLDRYGDNAEDNFINISEAQKLNGDPLTIKGLFPDYNFIQVDAPFVLNLPERTLFGYSEVRILTKDFTATFPHIALPDDSANKPDKKQPSETTLETTEADGFEDVKKKYFSGIGSKGGKAKKRLDLLQKYVEFFVKDEKSITFKNAWKAWKKASPINFENEEINFTETQVEICGKNRKKETVKKYFYDAKKAQKKVS